MLKLVLFDAGGTLVTPDYARVRRALERSVGRAPTVEALVEAEYAGREAIEAAMAADPALQDGSRWLIHFGGALASLGFSRDELARAAPAIKAEHQQANLWSIVPSGVVGALARLRTGGLAIGCVSNSDGTVAELLEGVGLADLLDFVVDSGVVGVEKPDPAIFRIALEQAGVAPAEAMYVGDLYPVDVVGARRAGIMPVLLDPLSRYRWRDCRTARSIPALCDELVSQRSAG